MTNLLGFWTPGPLELIIAIIVAILLLNKFLPNISRYLGKVVGKFKNGLKETTSEFHHSTPNTSQYIDNEPEQDSKSGYYLIKKLLKFSSVDTETLKNLLVSDASSTKFCSDSEQFSYLKNEAINGFLHCAANNITFTDIHSVQKYFGRSLEEAYPVASVSFMALARAYWTFKVKLIEYSHQQSVCIKLLKEIDASFSGVFFPTPGPFSQNNNDRERVMRFIIQESGAKIDIEDFIKGNPYLR